MTDDPKQIAIWRSWADDVLSSSFIPSGPSGGLAQAVDGLLAERSALLAEVDRLNAAVARLATERIECPRCLYEFRLDGVPVEQ
jgi:hypothetical protein